MLMQMLVAGGLPAFTDDARGPDPSNPRGYLEHERVKSLARDASWVPDAAGRALKVVAPLLPYLPSNLRYCVLFIERPLEDVLASQEAMLSAHGVAPAASGLLRRAYTAHLDGAHRWASGAPEAESLRLGYGDVVAHPDAAAERIAAFLSDSGVSLDSEAMASAVDPALRHHRTP